MHSLHIVAVGYYGAGNIGDELLLSILNNWCVEENCHLTAVSLDPEGTRKNLGINAIDFFDLPSLIQTMQNADLLVLGGGGLFQDHHQFSIKALYSYLPGDIAAYARPFFMARQLGVKTLAWAQGVGPLDGMESRQIVREVFTLADWVSVRDEGSAELLREIGVTRIVKIAPDPVWAWHIINKKNKSEISEKKSHSQKKLAMVLRPWSFVNGWEDRLVTAIKAIVPNTFTLIWLPFQSHQIDGRSTSDIAFLESLIVRLRDTHECILCANLTITETVETLAACDAIFAMRLHAQILALAMDIPTLCYEYDPKMTATSVWAEVPEELRVSVLGTTEQLKVALKALTQEPKGPAIHTASILATRAKEHHQLLRHAITETLRAKTSQKQWKALDFDWISAWRDGQIACLMQSIAERDGQIASLTPSITELDGKNFSLTQLIAERDGQVANLTQSIVERDDEIFDLNKILIKQSEKIVSINQELFERDEKIQSFISSRSWQFTRPIRAITRPLRKIFIQDERYKFLKAVYWSLPEFFRLKLNKKRYEYIAKRIHHNGTFKNRSTLPSVDLFDEKNIWIIKANQAERIAIIPCGFEFDELVNQRPINAAKYFADQGYLVLFVAWQWSQQDTMTKGYNEVWPNVYQVPLFDFISKAENISHHDQFSIFMVTMPAPVLVNIVPSLRQRGFAIVYDIMDNWESFAEVGQSPWYLRSVENALILQADYVCGVSPSLREKFSHLRSDIGVIGNGYNPNVIGIEHKGIARNQRENRLIVGYFGHLTDAWFNWNIVLDLAKNRKDIVFEIIGYGEPEWVRREVAENENIHLLGKIPPKELYRYAARWSVGIIPFVEGVLAEAVDPIKIYEYLYFGIPVVVTGIRHLKNYPMTYFSERNNILDVLNCAIQCDSTTDDIEFFLKNTTWQSRFDILVSEVKKNQNIRNLYAN